MTEERPNLRRRRRKGKKGGRTSPDCLAKQGRAFVAGIAGPRCCQSSPICAAGWRRGNTPSLWLHQCPVCSVTSPVMGKSGDVTRDWVSRVMWIRIVLHMCDGEHGDKQWPYCSRMIVWRLPPLSPWPSVADTQLMEFHDHYHPSLSSSSPPSSSGMLSRHGCRRDSSRLFSGR